MYHKIIIIIIIIIIIMCYVEAKGSTSDPDSNIIYGSIYHKV